MTRKVGNTLYIEKEPCAVCEVCGKLDKLRHYGPNDENICFDCAMKDEATTARKFIERLEGPGEKSQ